MKLLTKIKQIFFVVLIAGLFVFLPTYAQETGDLRYNKNIDKIEIFVNERNVHYSESGKTKDGWYSAVGYKDVRGWFDLDSLCTEEGDFLDYNGTMYNIGVIREYRRLFNVFMDEREGKKHK